MNENYNEKNGLPAEELFPEEAAFEEEPVIMRKKIKGGYNWAGGIILLTQGLALAAMIIFSVIFSVTVTSKIMAENPGAEITEITSKVQDAASENRTAIISNAVCMVVSEVVTILIVCFSAKRFRLRDTLKKPSSPASHIIMAMLAIIGVQGFSIFVQGIVSSLTGFTGINEDFSAQMSFGDDILANTVLALYAVLIGPILEELLYRGLAMNLLAPVNRTFALIASSLLFGLMHANFNQIFNGFLLGLVLGYIALKSGSVISSVICHIFANGNAFLISYIFEGKMAGSIGEEAAAGYELLVFGIELVIGVIALILLMKKSGRVTQDDMITPQYSYAETTGKYTWSALLRSPTFWLSAAYCLISACMMITPINA